MAVFFLSLIALILIGTGIYLLTASLDTLWQRQERQLKRSGLAPLRTPEWERSTRVSGWFVLAMGLLPLVVAIMLGSSSTHQQMAGVGINGHELTQAEWDACGHNFQTCPPNMLQRWLKSPPNQR